jgi:hypothetical protein
MIGEINMKQTFFILKNHSQSNGTYYINGEYKTLMPGEQITYDHQPTNHTSNIIVTMYRKELKTETPILNKKRR